MVVWLGHLGGFYHFPFEKARLSFMIRRGRGEGTLA
jgi:hypothetical protein